MAFLEWIDPPIVGGHWSPELIALAGGSDVLGVAGTPSRRAEWHELAAARPELLCLACCGFTARRAREELERSLDAMPATARRFVEATPVAIFDGVGLFSRPGPRLAESLERLSAALHPELGGD